jgi:VWFA-related protein
MTRTRIRLLVAVSLLAALTARPAGQQQPPAQGQTPATDQPAVTFRVEINYVEVDAGVFDNDGRFVSDLRRDDFEVFEDGVRQNVSAFSLVNLPIERAERPLFARQPIEPDVVSNAKPFDGRVYVMVLDDLHTSAGRSVLVRRAAQQFIEQAMAANDAAAIVYTSGRGEAGQDFTSNKRLLLASVDRFLGRKLRSRTLERLDEYQRQRALPSGSTQQGSRINDPLDMQRGHEARGTLDALKKISDYVSSIHGRRKAIVYLSEGIDYDIYDFNNRESTTILEGMKDVIATATRSNVSIYAVDPRGLTQLADDTIEVSGGFPDDPSLNLSMQSFQDELRLSQMSLRTLAEDTGGYAAVNSNDFTKAWDRIVADNSSYYVLGYYPTNDKRDGRFRKIEVKARRDGLEVRTRKGYTAPRGKAPAPTPPSGSPTEKASPELREALDSPLPLPALTLRAYAAPFKGAAPNASVAIGVEAEGADLGFAQKDGKFVNDIEVSAIAIDAGGKVRDGLRDVLNMGLKPETRARVAETGIRLQSRLKLPPGRYQLRLAAREVNGGRVGSVTRDLEVPDFTKDPLTMSGVVIASGQGQVILTAKADEELKGVLPVPATATRTFRSGDALATFVEVYDNQPKPPHKVDITTSVLTDEGRVVFNTHEERESSELQGKAGGYGVASQIPLAGFTPGLYVLKIEATSRAGKPVTVDRQVPFRVQ